MKTKKILVPVIVLVLLAGGFVGYRKLKTGDVPEAMPEIVESATVVASSEETEVPEVQEVDKTVKLIITGKKDPLELETEIDSKTDAFNLLKRLAESNDITLKYSESAFGVFVEQIGSTKNVNSEFWMYYVNGEYGKVASDRQPVKGGDTVEWRFE